MTNGERDPADSGNSSLSELFRQAMKDQGWRSETAVAAKSAEMGDDYKFSRQTLRNYLFGHREGGDGQLAVNPDLVRRIAAVLQIDPREALHAAGLHHEAERHPPSRTKADAPLDSKEVTADKLATLPYADRLALQHIIDSLVAAHADAPTPGGQAVITSVPGGEAWRGRRSSAGSGTAQAAEEAHS